MSAPVGPAPRVVVIGSLNVDILVRVERLPQPGETVLGAEGRTAAGGKGANQAAAAARLGAMAALVGRVGRDAHGRRLREVCRGEGIDLHYVRGGAHPTGIAVIVVDTAGENLIAVAPGANAAVTPRDVVRAAPLLAAADIVVAQLEVPVEAVCEAARLAREAGVPFLLNAAPARDDLDPLLRLVDILVVNQSELARLAGTRSLRGIDDESAAALRLREHGPSRVVVTLGARGALATTADGTVVAPAFPVEAVDTTGAGDAFVGAFAVRCAQGVPIQDALRYACAAAALCCTREGALPSLPTAAVVDAFLRGRTVPTRGHAPRDGSEA